MSTGLSGCRKSPVFVRSYKEFYDWGPRHRESGCRSTGHIAPIIAISCCFGTQSA